MSQLASIRVMLFCLELVLVLVAGCNAPLTQNEQETQLKPPSWRDRVARIVQPGWEVEQIENSIIIKRREPVTYYNPIALPPPGEMRTRMIEQSRRMVTYGITLDIVQRLTEEKYEELKAVNAKTKKELEILEDRMRSFASKGSYRPNTDKDRALYKEYRSHLLNLLYHRLPDLYDDKHSIYVKTTRHPWSAFYSVREELECRALLENIYSFAEVYEGKKSVAWPPEAEYAIFAVFEAFESRRDYDRYIHKREMNLEGQPED